MEKIKNFYNKAKLNIVYFVVSNWNSDRLFDKGKIIFIGIVLLFLLIKLIYTIIV